MAKIEKKKTHTNPITILLVVTSGGEVATTHIEHDPKKKNGPDDYDLASSINDALYSIDIDAADVAKITRFDLPGQEIPTHNIVTGKVENFDRWNRTFVPADRNSTETKKVLKRNDAFGAPDKKGSKLATKKR